MRWGIVLVFFGGCFGGVDVVRVGRGDRRVRRWGGGREGGVWLKTCVLFGGKSGVGGCVAGLVGALATPVRDAPR